MSERIDESQVRHISHLSRLDLSDEEVAQFGTQLSSILEYVAKLNELDTESVEPTAHPLPVRNVLAADEVKASMGVDPTMANAPDSEPPYFKVPKVLDQQTA